MYEANTQVSAVYCGSAPVSISHSAMINLSLCVPISNFAFQFEFFFVSFHFSVFFSFFFFNCDDFVLNSQVSYLIYLWPFTFIRWKKENYSPRHSVFSHIDGGRDSIFSRNNICLGSTSSEKQEARREGRRITQFNLY